MNSLMDMINANKQQTSTPSPRYLKVDAAQIARMVNAARYNEVAPDGFSFRLWGKAQ